MIKFKTMGTHFSQSLFGQFEWGFPLGEGPLLEKVKTILSRLLKHTKLSGILELDISDMNDVNAGSDTISPDQYELVVSRGAVIQQTDAALAAELGHELGHIVKGFAEDPEGQIKADVYGLSLALRAGYSKEELRTRVAAVAKFADPEMNVVQPRIDAMEKFLDRSK